VTDSGDFLEIIGPEGRHFGSVGPLRYGIDRCDVGGMEQKKRMLTREWQLLGQWSRRL